MVETLKPHVVNASLNYYLSPERGGDPTYYPGAVADKRRKHDPKNVSITDIRGNEDNFKLDKQGFQIIQLETDVQDVENDADWKKQYYSDILEQVRRITGASRAHPVSHLARRKAFDDVLNAEKGMDEKAAVTAATYNRAIHVDQSYTHARTILNNHFPETSSEIASKRWAIVNVWRPLVRTVTRDNLALCNAWSVKDSELVPLKGALPGPSATSNGWNWTTKAKAIELFFLNASEDGNAHEWYYCSKLTPQEGILFKQFDSKLSGVPRRVPHSAFVCDEDYGPKRESIEFRILLIWDDQTND